jgi:adenosylhomocysteine nucleosidase
MSPDAAWVGYVAALRMESRWLVGAVAPGMIEVSGPGRHRAEAAAHRLVECGARALVSWGVAGGLDPDLPAGRVVLVSGVDTADGSAMDADPGWLAGLHERVGSGVTTTSGRVRCVDEVVASVSLKQELWRTSGAAIVDMESAGIARAAAEAGVPWIGVRGVTDAAGEMLPVDISALTSETGGIRPGAVLRLLFRPSIWPALAGLRRATGNASESMRGLVRVAGADLAFGDIGV